MEIKEKYELALKAQKNSYAPYSKFKVGAVLLFNDGSYELGCNVENASYGLCNCAERTAMFKAISNGKNLKEVKELIVIAPAPRPVSPCGACRQVMSELLNKDVKITMFNMNMDYKVTTVEELLPYAFTEDDVNG